MSLVICPECGNEVSSQAPLCPKCGHPFEAPTVVVQPPPAVVREPVIVAEPPRRNSFPNWIFVPIIVILAVVALFMFLMMRESSDDANNNRTQVNVRLRESETAGTRTVSNSTAQTGTAETATTTTRTIETAPVTQMPDSTASSIPQTAYPTTGTTSTTTTTTELPPDKGKLEIKATVASRSGSPQPVKQEKFYLLNKSLDEILSRANIDAEEGDLASTCAAAVIDPARRETRSKCLAAIKPHIIYSVTTDSTGKGSFSNVKPDSYYVFGVTKVGSDSYAIWNTTVTVNPGDNLLNLNGSGSPLSPVGANSPSY